MQMSTRKVMNRKIDDDIISALNTATNVFAGGPATLALVQNALAKLGRQDVEVEDEDHIYWLASLSFRAELMQIKEFNSADWVETKPLKRSDPALQALGRRELGLLEPPARRRDQQRARLPLPRRRDRPRRQHAGGGVAAGYNDEDDYSWARSSIFMGSTVLQNKGILVVPHDGSAVG